MQVPVELKRRYLRRRIQDLQSIMHSLEKDDFSMAQTLGHQVKGNAVTFDFPQMAMLGVEIERAAKKKDKERVLNLAHQLRSFVDSAHQEI